MKMVYIWLICIRMGKSKIVGAQSVSSYGPLTCHPLPDLISGGRILSHACSLIEWVGWDGMMWAGTARCVLREGPAPTCGRNPYVAFSLNNNGGLGRGIYQDQ